MSDKFFSPDNKGHYVSDLYRIQNNLPLQGESHSRYISSKAPIRKNKDFRARPRSYFAGFPIYKKDHYTRHYYNFLDILNSDHVVVKYFKIGMMTYISSFFTYLVYDTVWKKGSFGNIIDHKQLNYVGFSGYSNNFKVLKRTAGKPALLFTIFFTSALFFREFIE